MLCIAYALAVFFGIFFGTLIGLKKGVRRNLTPYINALKNLVKVMLESDGYSVIDLGRDVPAANFVDTAIEQEAKVIALSILMTTSMGNMQKVVEGLVEKGVRDRFKVVVGGGPISQSFSDKIGADGYSATAVDAVKLVNSLVM